MASAHAKKISHSYIRVEFNAPPFFNSSMEDNLAALIELEIFQGFPGGLATNGAKKFVSDKGKNKFMEEYQSDIDDSKSKSEDCVKSKVEKYGPQGKMMYYYDMGHDKYGQLTDQYYYGPKGQLMMYSSLNYSASGLLLGKYIYDHSGALQSAVGYTYENGLLTRQTLLDKSGNVKRAIQYEYEEGKKVQETVEDGKGRILYYTSYSYQQDQLTSWARYSRGGELLLTSYAYYQSAREMEQQQRESIKNYYEEQKGKANAYKDYVVESFDAQTRQRLVEVYTAGGLLVASTANKYDEYGNLVSQQTHDAYGNVTGSAFATFDCE
ncbi:MAG: hypothetical protein MI784_16835 [Cytophagales bacterium]|nr:hypothetical protein [Cytophagales bacterium]